MTKTIDSEDRDLINAVGLLFFDAMSVKCEPSSYAQGAIKLVLDSLGETFTADQVRNRLRSACDAAGGQAAWARDHGVSPQYVCDVLTGGREPGMALTTGLGLVENPRSWRLDSVRIAS